MNFSDRFRLSKDFTAVNGGGKPLLDFMSSLPKDDKNEKVFNIMLTEKSSRLICTFIRRSIFEQYERNMSEAGFTPEQNKEITYDTIAAFNDLREQIINQP